MSHKERALPGLVGLPPVADVNTRLLILGSFPGEASLRAAQYYAHPQNHFWPLLGRVLGLPLETLVYEARLRALLEHHIGVWDVIQSCRRRGSLDAEIREARMNSFAWLRKDCPRLRAVFFNGKKSAQSAPQLAALGYATYVLPSSSPAYTLSLEEKARAWQQIAVALNAKDSANYSYIFDGDRDE